MRYKGIMKILIAVDEDDASHDAVEFAAQFLDDQAEVLVVNVARSTITPYGTIGGLSATYAGSPMLSADAELRAQEQADQEAERVVSAAERLIKGAKVEGRVEHGDVGPAICQVAADEDADMIVLGTHDRGVWSRLWFGSVSDHVVHNAPCPVLVVRR